MPKSFAQDEKVIWEITFYSDKNKTIPVDPVTRKFEVKKPDGTVDDTTVPIFSGTTGKWRAEYVVDQFGTWEWRWITETPRVVAQGEIWVVENNVDG